MYNLIECRPGSYIDVLISSHSLEVIHDHLREQVKRCICEIIKVDQVMNENDLIIQEQSTCVKTRTGTREVIKTIDFSCGEKDQFVYQLANDHLIAALKKTDSDNANDEWVDIVLLEKVEVVDNGGGEKGEGKEETGIWSWLVGGFWTKYKTVLKVKEILSSIIIRFGNVEDGNVEDDNNNSRQETFNHNNINNQSESQEEIDAGAGIRFIAHIDEELREKLKERRKCLSDSYIGFH